MTRRTWLAAVTFTGSAALFLVLGAAMRPLLVDDAKTPAPLLGSTEIGFVQDMVAHHNQALLLVQRLDSGVDPAVRALAQQIADTQRTEIGMLLGWLRIARTTVTNPRPMAWMHTDPPATAHHPATGTPTNATMPGMASQTELDTLATARARDAETQFLQLMQRHHYGGIQMAQAAITRVTDSMVVQTARDIIVTQGQEVGVITLLLLQRTTPQ